MVRYPNKDAIRENVDLTIHAVCTHISKDLQKFIKRHIFARMDSLDGLSLRELDVLLCIEYFRDAVTSADVAETIRFDPATVTRATQNLLDQGLLTKRDNVNDSRSVLLSLTEKGEEIAREFKEKSADALHASDHVLKTSLTPGETEDLLRLLLKMRNKTVEYAQAKKLPALDTKVGDNVSNFADARRAKTA